MCSYHEEGGWCACYAGKIIKYRMIEIETEFNNSARSHCTLPNPNAKSSTQFSFLVHIHLAAASIRGWEKISN